MKCDHPIEYWIDKDGDLHKCGKCHKYTYLYLGPHGTTLTWESWLERFNRRELKEKQFLNKLKRSWEDLPFHLWVHKERILYKLRGPHDEEL